MLANTESLLADHNHSSPCCADTLVATLERGTPLGRAMKKIAEIIRCDEKTLFSEADDYCRSALIFYAQMIDAALVAANEMD